ncbi:MAG: dTDP-4-amino-4,6-dideoxygalactose transaminase [Blastopirellula sp.]|mgnify:CR=1 FL=1|nr:dTDP-4-amino-4,6-dideoxygalactose transaminase [Blastopirellula sp.]
MEEFIPFNKPYMTGRELENIRLAHEKSHLSGNGAFSKECHSWLEAEIKCDRALLTHSCTAALEIAALLIDVKPGDEIIMPSFTFVSTANAFALRGAVPVFVDIREDTLNLDEKLIESAITSRTRAIVVVHYAGVACEMDVIKSIAHRHDLRVIEDSAQAIKAYYKGQPLGSVGDLGALSFHETKNIIAGEGGALLVNDASLAEQAEVIWEKGTDRNQYQRGEVEKYTWQGLGSSFLPGEVTAAFLMAQLSMSDWITENRLDTWSKYHQELLPLEESGFLRRPIVPNHCLHNAHMYFVLLPGDICRETVLKKLNASGINAVFHYVPLHDSPGGQRFGRLGSSLKNTEDQSSRLIRLPLWVGISDSQVMRVVETLGANLMNAKTRDRH